MGRRVPEAEFPHAHVLLFLAVKDKARTAEDVDRFVSADIPSRSRCDAQPELHRLVEAHVEHRPCGHLNPLCSCMKDVQRSTN